MRNLLALLAPALLSGAAAQAHLDLPGRTGPAWVICDALNAPRTLVIEHPDATGRAVVTTLDHRTDQYAYEAWQVGRPEPAAGSISRSLRPRNGDAGADGDALRFVNSGVSFDPDLYRFTPALATVTLRGEAHACRLLPGVRLMGVTSDRTVTVTQDTRGALTYRSYDFGRDARRVRLPGDTVAQTTAPSLLVRSGREVNQGDEVTYTFTNDGYRYVVRVEGGSGSVTVSRDGRVLQREALRAFITGGAGR